MRSMLKYITAEEMIDCAEAQFFDDVAEGLHNRTVYDYIKKNVIDLHPSALTGLLESLDGHDMELIDQCTDWFAVKVTKGRILDGRKDRANALFLEMMKAEV